MSSNEPFLTSRFEGKRFTDHSLPLELLSDLAVIEDLLQDLVKQAFLSENPKRQRVPRRFFEQFSLKLTGIHAGSAVVQIGLSKPVTQSQLFLEGVGPAGDPNRNRFDQAIDTFFDAIDAASSEASDEAITEHIPADKLKHFDKLGKHLQDDETISFKKTNGNGQPRRVSYTKQTRQNLILASSKSNEYAEHGSMQGRVVSMDRDDKKFELKLASGKKLKATFTKEIEEPLMKAFNSARPVTNNHPIQIEAQLVYDRSHSLKELRHIEDVTQLSPLDTNFQLDELAHLKDGWLDGEGIAPDSQTIEKLKPIFDHLFEWNQLPLPRLYPTEEGNVLAEWLIDRQDLSLDVTLDENLTATFDAVNLDDEEDDGDEQQFKLKEPEDVEAFIKHFSQYIQNT